MEKKNFSRMGKQKIIDPLARGVDEERRGLERRERTNLRPSSFPRKTLGSNRRTVAARARAPTSPPTRGEGRASGGRLDARGRVA